MQMIGLKENLLHVFNSETFFFFLQIIFSNTFFKCIYV